MMKKTIFTVVLLGMAGCLFAQIKNHVQWSFEARKKTANVYEVVLTANVDNSWHIYSQTTPDGGPKPTVIKFKANPLLSLEGKVKENGSIKKIHDKSFGIDVLYYSDKVEFIQTVKLKGNVKTNITGTVGYMTCDDIQCMPPTTKEFDIKLQ